ncbi:MULTISPECIES: helix-turn-helix domain-containing protein [unclassified Microbacterium]|uniref:helix-turn-helix domain-containing protein n=1 Tax=unclassified Microbacterium TaxID=2609290 RepID=UPI0036629E2E
MTAYRHSTGDSASEPLAERLLFNAHGAAVHDLRGSRGRYRISAPHDDAHVLFVFARQGEAFVSSSEHPRPLRADRRHGLLLVSRDPVTILIDAPTHAQVAWVAGSALRRRGHPVSQHLTVVPPGSVLVSALLRLVDIDPSTLAVTDVARETLAGIGIDLIAGTLNEVARAEAGPVGPRDRRAAAMALVYTHRRDPAFTVSMLSRELALSPRQLNRVFAAFGTTAADELRRARLELFRELSASPLHRDRPLRTLAAMSGFPSAAALRRALRAGDPASHARD